MGLLTTKCNPNDFEKVPPLVWGKTTEFRAPSIWASFIIDPRYLSISIHGGLVAVLGNL